MTHLILKQRLPEERVAYLQLELVKAIAEAKAAEHRGFVRGLEAARRIASSENRRLRAADLWARSLGAFEVFMSITARIAKERKKATK